MPTLEFTLMVGCPLKCTFCPQDSLRRLYADNPKYLSLQHFRTILGKIPKHVRIDFSGMAEPWANPDATEMVRHALTLDYTIAIYTTLYGMTAEDGAAVIDLLKRHSAQIEVLCLHLPDRNGNMRGWRHDAVYEENLRGFLSLGDTKVLANFQVMTMDASGEVHPSLGHLGIRLPPWRGHSRAGNVTERDVQGQQIANMPEHHGAVCCSYTPFYDQNVCLPNGDVVLCCMDYSLKHKIGNLLEQDYYEMFGAGRLSALVAENMKPHFSRESLCKTCDRARRFDLRGSRQIWQST